MASTVADRTRATLLSLGMPADTPATWVVNVSLPGQAVLATTVGELGPLPQEHAGQAGAAAAGNRRGFRPPSGRVRPAILASRSTIHS